MKHRHRHDVIVVGGGLSGCLTAWWLRHCAPALDVLLVERSTSLGGNHTWSFFASDLTAEEHERVAPFVAHAWPAYRVRFPRHERTLSTGYRSITSGQMAEVVTAGLGKSIRVGVDAVSVGPHQVTFCGGDSLEAECVLDARGAKPSPSLAVGFQKFLGLELRLEAPHGEALPMIMDASVAQHDGYRFVYALPLAADRILIEDTYYTDDERLTHERLSGQIRDYARSKGWTVAATIREEHGVLPIILAGDIDRHLAQDSGGAPRIGLGGAFFHPTTGYSLPDAVRVAGLIGKLAAMEGALRTETVRNMLSSYARRLWSERSYFRLLNRMMFQAGEPGSRYTILERFYRLDAGLVQRFYAATLTPLDKLRIVAGRPPVPILSALACVSEKRTLAGFKGRS